MFWVLCLFLFFHISYIHKLKNRKTLKDDISISLIPLHSTVERDLCYMKFLVFFWWLLMLELQLENQSTANFIQFKGQWLFNASECKGLLIHVVILILDYDCVLHDCIIKRQQKILGKREKIRMVVSLYHNKYWPYYKNRRMRPASLWIVKKEAVSK